MNTLPHVVRKALEDLDHYMTTRLKDTDMNILSEWFVVRQALLTYSRERMQLLLEMQDFRDHVPLAPEEPNDG